MYDLHNLHVHPSGIHFLIFYLDSLHDLHFLITVGTTSHVLGPL